MTWFFKRKVADEIQVMIKLNGTTSSNIHTIKESIDKNTLSCKEIIAGLPQAFNAAAVTDLQFNINGAEASDCFLHIVAGNYN